MNTECKVSRKYCPVCSATTEHTQARMCTACGNITPLSLRTRVDFKREPAPPRIQLPAPADAVLAALEDYDA